MAWHAINKQTIGIRSRQNGGGVTLYRHNVVHTWYRGCDLLCVHLSLSCRSAHIVVVKQRRSPATRSRARAAPPQQQRGGMSNINNAWLVISASAYDARAAIAIDSARHRRKRSMYKCKRQPDILLPPRHMALKWHGISIWRKKSAKPVSRSKGGGSVTISEISSNNGSAAGEET